jgi:hypothetical protein
VKPLDPYRGPDEPEPLTGAALIREVAFYKETARQQGTKIDPEWDRWLQRRREGRGPGHPGQLPRGPVPRRGQGPPVQVQKVDRDVLGDGVWADTNMVGISHKIRLSDAMWDDPVVKDALKDNEGVVIATEAKTPAEFRKMASSTSWATTSTPAAARRTADATATPTNGLRGPLDELAGELTTPRKRATPAVPPGERAVGAR